MRGVLLVVLAALAWPSWGQPLRVSAWYWLNSAPRTEWERDFRDMRDMGFTHAVLCWGLDAAAFGLREDDTRRALDACRRSGLGAYLMIWHPSHNSLPRKPEFQQRDAAGRLRFTFDVFNPEWRRTQWKDYLQKVARAYREHPAMAGYVFDDSFEIGPIEHFGGQGGPAAERVISYGEVERQRFGGDLPRTPSDPKWKEWVEACAGWWEDWARDTVGSLREIDPDPRHEIYLEDADYVLGPRVRETVGLDFGRVARHFDAVCAYTAAPWDAADSGERVAAYTREVLQKTRAAVGPDKKIIYTFWAGNIKELRTPGPARYPTAAQIRQIAQAARAFGIRHLDMYGYRIGEYSVSEKDWPSRRPGTGPEYPLTGDFPGKYLFDREEVKRELRPYLRGLTVGPTARTWLPEPRDLSPLEPLCTGVHSDPCDVGLEWSAPESVSALAVDYATLAGRAYQPDAAGQTLEYWTGSGWRAIPAAIEIDYREQARFAPLEGSGTARWTYRFAPVRTTRLRVLLTHPQNHDPGHRCYAVREIRTVPAAAGDSRPGFRVLGELAAMPAWLEPGANLAVPAAGARIAGGEVRWPRRLLMNRVDVQPAASIPAVEWWDGSAWRAVEPLAARKPGEVRFMPVATARLRVKPPSARVEVRLDSEGERYFAEVERSRTDVLGGRFTRMPQPGLAAMQGLLLPLDFAKTAIGRPADEQETVVMWNGTFLMTEPGKDLNDRWFAPAAGSEPRLFGTDWAYTATEYAEGYLPATVTTFHDQGCEFAQKLYVTAPGDARYGTVAEVTVKNRSGAPRQTAFTLALGRRRNQRSPGRKSSPLFFEPQVTGYRLDADGRTVRSASGDTILIAESQAVWEGTPRENHLRYALKLAPGESRTLRFFVPSVERPVRDVQAPDWAATYARFRHWWDRKLAGGMQIEVPEARLNRIWRNLLAQSLIITMDGDALVRYGAYFYESYFGVEEGWPAVALAQFGHAAEAQKIMSAMLAPELMDKKNYHHQYRNGLEPWYAITIYRLTNDRAWLEKIAPDLEAAAEWTIRTITANRDAKYPGILPRHAYGGDIHTPAYSFYSNATCWRGLNDTALAFRILGRAEQARRYQEAANRYRRRLVELADQLAERGKGPVFLPMSFDVGSGHEYREKEPAYEFLGINMPASHTWTYLGNYWNLFAPMLLEVKLFENDDPRARWIPGYMDARGGILAGLVRFTLGLDQIYGKGYYESLLEHGRRAEFLTSLYGVFAHGMSENLYSFPEVAGVFPMRVSNAAMWREYQRNLWNWYFLWDWGFEGWQTCEGEPLSAGPGMALQMLRMALVRETTETAPQDTLRLLDGAPANWFEPGKRIVVRDAPTFFGKVSLETEGTAGRVRATVTRPEEFRARRVVLRLGRDLREVTVNGQPWREFSGAEVTLPVGERVEVAASYR